MAGHRPCPIVGTRPASAGTHEDKTMRPTSTVAAVGLFIAEDRARRDRQAADARRRLSTRPDVDPDPLAASPAPGRRSIAGRLVGAFHQRLARPLA
jgi:hypothetical protein